MAACPSVPRGAPAPSSVMGGAARQPSSLVGGTAAGVRDGGARAAASPSLPGGALLPRGEAGRVRDGGAPSSLPRAGGAAMARLRRSGYGASLPPPRCRGEAERPWRGEAERPWRRWLP